MPTPISSASPRADRLSGKVAIVSGSTHGIGLGIARRFAREGASLVINDAGEHGGEEIAAGIRELGAEAIYVRADASDADAVERLVGEAVSEYGRIDVVANNVGGWRHGPFETRELDDWEFVVNATLRSHWLTARHAVEHMPPGGSVVNVSSVHSLATNAGSFPYNVAKTGVNGLTRAMAIELGPRDVRVNAILPGAIHTGDADVDPAALERPRLDPDELVPDRVVDPAGRRGVPADIAGCAAFLASDDAGFVTGACIPVDGGRLAVLDGGSHADWREEQYDYILLGEQRPRRWPNSTRRPRH